ncbi:MAG: 1-phosphofructokinase family hexose kinase [Erysipelothrix sp.]
MRIVTLTLNPAIDKTLYCDSFSIGDTNRIQSIIEDIAGKGINVTKNLREHDLQSTVVGIFAGEQGQRSYESLCRQGFEVIRIEAEGETRVNQKIVDKMGITTELNELGPMITQQTIETLYTWIDLNACKEDLYILSGSLPQGAPKTLYRDLVMKLNDLGAKTILDASGESLIEGLKGIPYCVKPNDDEIQTLLQLNRKPTEIEMVQCANDIINTGVELVVISLGKEGAYFISKNQLIKGEGLDLISQSSVGAGDAMVSALAYSIFQEYTLEDTAIRAIATSGAAVETKGTKPGSKKRVQELMKLVKIEKGELI